MSRRKRFTAGAFRAAHAAGCRTRQDFIDALGCSPSTALLLSRETGISFERHTATQKARRRRVTEVARAYIAGASLTEICAELGLKESTVTRHLTAAGLVPRPSVVIKRQRELAKALWRNTDLQRIEIAGHIGVHPASVARYLAGEPPRRGKQRQ